MCEPLCGTDGEPEVEAVVEIVLVVVGQQNEGGLHGGCGHTPRWRYLPLYGCGDDGCGDDGCGDDGCGDDGMEMVWCFFLEVMVMVHREPF